MKAQRHPARFFHLPIENATAIGGGRWRPASGIWRLFVQSAMK